MGKMFMLDEKTHGRLKDLSTFTGKSMRFIVEELVMEEIIKKQADIKKIKEIKETLNAKYLQKES